MLDVRFLFFTLAASTTFAAPDVSQLPPPAAKQVDFVTDIRPIFEQSCLRCHGPDRPKSRFRLDNRESALKGGMHGVDLIPGDSAKSPLIHNVARLDADMAMPPEGKGDPLTTEQIALLRAWIDQGAAWGGEETSRFSYALTPAFGFVAVDGNEAKFREHNWIPDGGRGGLESFEFWQTLSPETKFTLGGRAMTDDYRVEGLLEKSELGFVGFGWEQFRKYDSDIGGYVPGLGDSPYSLNRDLHLDVGRAWIDLGLTLPDWPRLVLGYELQYRHGDKATLQWGPVGPIPPTAETRSIYPALKTIDENIHVLKFDVQFERAGWLLEESFRGEWTDSQTRRLNGRKLLLDGAGSLGTDDVAEGWQSFQGANTLRVEREFREWLHISTGWLYSHLSADADFNLETRNPAGGILLPPILRGPRHSESIVLERESQVVNANALFGPWAGLSLALGVQAEWTHQNGTAAGFYDFPLSAQAKNFIADLDKAAIAEHISLRFTGLPFTTLYTEAKLQQECIGHHEDYEEDIGDQRFQRNTDVESGLREFQIGFDSSPRSWLKFGSQFRFYDKETTFDDGFTDSVDPIGGYPTFFESLQRTTHEIKSRLTLRPARRLTTTFTHRLVATDYETDKESRTNPTTGGRWTSGKYDAQILSLNATVAPWRRLYCSGTISYQDIESTSRHDNSAAVVPYRGETWSVMGHARFVLNEKTDLTAGYTFSMADFRQTNFDDGLPLGIEYDMHGIQAGFVTRCTKDLTLKLQYGFYRYDEPSSGGANDYTAHAVLAALTLRLP